MSSTERGEFVSNEFQKGASEYLVTKPSRSTVSEALSARAPVETRFFARVALPLAPHEIATNPSDTSGANPCRKRNTYAFTSVLMPVVRRWAVDSPRGMISP